MPANDHFNDSAIPGHKKNQYHTGQVANEERK
jgi:hypothetical protein